MTSVYMNWRDTWILHAIADSNEAIITQEQFDRTQALRKNRKAEQSENIHAYLKRCFCSCGSRCRSKHINQIWYWVCVAHEEQKGVCQIKQVPEETIMPTQPFIRSRWQTSPPAQQPRRRRSTTRFRSAGAATSKPKGRQ